MVSVRNTKIAVFFRETTQSEPVRVEELTVRLATSAAESTVKRWAEEKEEEEEEEEDGQLGSKKNSKITTTTPDVSPSAPKCIINLCADPTANLF